MHNIECRTGLYVQTYNYFDKIYFFSSYHIAGTKGVFFAREPYSNVDAVHVTRFLGLASVGNKEKQVCYGLGSPSPREHSVPFLMLHLLLRNLFMRFLPSHRLPCLLLKLV